MEAILLYRQVYIVTRQQLVYRVLVNLIVELADFAINVNGISEPS
jgi:hypothetical protein